MALDTAISLIEHNRERIRWEQSESFGNRRLEKKSKGGEEDQR